MSALAQVARSVIGCTHGERTTLTLLGPPRVEWCIACGAVRTYAGTTPGAWTMPHIIEALAEELPADVSMSGMLVDEDAAPEFPECRCGHDAGDHMITRPYACDAVREELDEEGRPVLFPCPCRAFERARVSSSPCAEVGQ